MDVKPFTTPFGKVTATKQQLLQHPILENPGLAEPHRFSPEKKVAS